jgi:hypothetical protein
MSLKLVASLGFALVSGNLTQDDLKVIRERRKRAIREYVEKINFSGLFVTMDGTPSKIYHAADYVKAFDMTSMQRIDHGLSELEPEKWAKARDTNALLTTEEVIKLGMVDQAALLSQMMVNGVWFDTCDENSWDAGFTQSNACGQNGMSYQDFKCHAKYQNMACPVDASMKVTAKDSATQFGAPPPLTCGSQQPAERYVNGAWQSCALPGCPNTPAVDFMVHARTNTVGCCWWGRGALQATGPCNVGRMNYYLGKKAGQRTGAALYPSIDFCANPEEICSSTHPELKFSSAMFYWQDTIQSEEFPGTNGPWKYAEAIRKWVAAGNWNDDSFIHQVSGAMSRGDANAPSSNIYRYAPRVHHFRRILKMFGFQNVAQTVLPSNFPCSGCPGHCIPTGMHSNLKNVVPVTPEMCSKCGSSLWYPCNEQNLCKCDNWNPTTASPPSPNPPSPSPSPSPSPPSPTPASSTNAPPTDAPVTTSPILVPSVPIVQSSNGHLYSASAVLLSMVYFMLY